MLTCDPYLPLPGAEASLEEWEAAVPIRDLPPLPPRGVGYWAEPWCGIFTVLGISGLLVSLTTSIVATGGVTNPGMRNLLVGAIWSWAGIAVLGTAYIVLGRAGEIQRTKQTCYPIPGEVAQRLVSSESLSGMKNVSGPEGSTYCVRCLVWRPGAKPSDRGHHCNTCQRCVTGFDHHCGVFGRCIVNANMICFHLVIGMFFMGAATSMGALLASSGNVVEGSYYTTPEPVASTTTAIWVN